MFLLFDKQFISSGIVMSGVNGINILNKLLKISQTATRTIFMIAKVWLGEIAKCMRLGAVGMIGKLLDSVKLVAKIEQNGGTLS